MNKGYFFKILGLCSTLLLLLGVVASADQNARIDYKALEEAEIGLIDSQESAITGNAHAGKIPAINTIPQDSVLLIPNVTDDNVGMYDPFDGEFLGILIADAAHLATPINAMKGPDGNIYVSDQIADGAFVYDTSGAYLFTFCDGTDGLNNIRGIDFRNDTLFLTSGDDYVAMFDAPHNRLPDFISGGFDPYDIHFLDDGRALVSDILGDNVRMYNADGTFSEEIFSIDFPMQVIYDDLAPGDYLNASFLSANQITDFDLNGTIQQTTAWVYGRGVYRLGNGNLLATSNHTSHSGVYEIEQGTGNIVEQKNSGAGFRFIELFVVGSGPSPTGRCCYDESLCADNTEAECIALNGSWDENLNCNDDPCPVSGCDYVPGDVNGSDSYNGLDITFGVAFFKGGADPLCDPCPISPCDAFFYCGDVNGSCSYNGLDITYGVAYFKGGANPIPCADCPPTP